MRWLVRPDSPLWIHPRIDPWYALWLFRFWRRMNARAYQAGLEATMELGRDTMTLFDRLRADGVEFEMHADGVVMAYTSREPFEAAIEEINSLGRFGYWVAESATGAGVADLEPALAPEVVGAFVVAQDRHLDPIALGAALVADLERRGVAVRARTPVTGFSLSGGRVDGVQTAAGREPAEAVVIAAGADTARLTGSLRQRVPIEAGKGYSVDLAPRPLSLRRPLYLHEERIAVTPLSDWLRLGGTMEVGGRSEEISPRRVGAIERGARRLLRGWPDAPIKRTYLAGRRPVTPDGLMAIGPLPRTPNAWVASGHAMLGVTLGPRTGELVAQGLLGGSVDPVLAPFAPGRFVR